MCLALQYLDENDVIHRDVKPANVLVDVVNGGQTGRFRSRRFDQDRGQVSRCGRKERARVERRRSKHENVRENWHAPVQSARAGR